MRRRTFRGAVAIMALTTAALIGTAGSALACVPGDDRAEGTVGNATTCEDIGLGQALDVTDQLQVTGGTTKDQYLTVTGVAKGVTVAAIVVKGGDEYNTYVPGKKGLPGTPPWEKLHAPMVGKDSKNVPTISHWFACGAKKGTPPTKTSTPPTKTSAPATSTKPSAPATSDTSVAPTSTTAPAAVPAGNESGTGGGLANTGFDNSWLIWVAGLLLVAGGGLLALLKFRRKASE
ncbi:LPXTG cell wall anchor domain-containing protein [Amycolatopsis australiensis]|uniref:LPXTG-motif cell wall anchor domain-containing protein n=1 Tax=Amycolatopsis australiensis TaxID=546364 RepID=A0A1K1R218_9PSEU|nr:LPXTG cell wall anchor domain-containing protein [Amycolatopsis australiensis]SFW65953.1 LPXTG-motif cell wall anchor domain-containing protein [Amycolatopsis australiensis]